MSEFILFVHVAATLVMTGVIWFVQIVHYPLMARVPADRFVIYEREHQHRTALVVGPAMLVEAATAALLLAIPPDGVSRPLAGLAGGLLAAIWVSTFLVQVPLHDRLARGFDVVAHRRLVRSNWVRTALWTGRGLLVLVLLRGMLVE